ncbi:hypothetical protein M8J76_014794 [Diaphorina citri]|nr:hypothetical protein M8J76_014794 [Diaphorina citri]
MCDNCDMASDMWTGWINRVRELWNPNLHRHAGNARGIRRIDSLPKPPNVMSHSHSEDRSGEGPSDLRMALYRRRTARGDCQIPPALPPQHLAIPTL